MAGPRSLDYHASLPPGAAMALGRVVGLEVVKLTATRGAIPSTVTPLWNDTNQLFYTPRTSAATLTISSSSGLDSSAGVGARTLLVEGLDASFEVISEQVTMNGQTGVTLSNSYIAVNRITILTAGTREVNQGTIYAGSGTVTAGVPAVIDQVLGLVNNGGAGDHAGVADSRMSSTVFTVPANHTFLINSFIYGVPLNSGQSHLSGIVDFDVENTLRKTVHIHEGWSRGPHDGPAFVAPIRIPEKHAFMGFAAQNVGGGNIAVYAALDGVLLDDTFNFGS